jgi:hypothetical protein
MEPREAQRWHARLADGRLRVQALVDQIFGAGKHKIDELAISFKDPELMEMFVEELRGNGWADMVRVGDLVYVIDAPAQRFDLGSSLTRNVSEYSVWYEFLANHTMAQEGWRLECVSAPGSPLHSSLPHQVTVVHASFKVADVMAYVEACRTMRAAGLRSYMECASAYGLFSYYRMPGHLGGGMRVMGDDMFLKPRISWADRPAERRERDPIPVLASDDTTT